MNKNKFLNLVQKQLSNGFNNSSISLNMKQILNHPKNEIIFNFPVKLSNIIYKSLKDIVYNIMIS